VDVAVVGYSSDSFGGVQTLRPIEREGRGGGDGRWWIKNAYFTSQVYLLSKTVSAGNTASLENI